MIALMLAGGKGISAVGVFRSEDGGRSWQPKNAGVPVILVPDGYTGVPAASLGADYVVGGLAEIPASLVPGTPIRRTA